MTGEIWDTIAYAKANKDNRELIDSLLGRAADCRGLSHREAAVLLECEIPEVNEAVKSLAREIKTSCTAAVLLCLRLCICPITVSMDVPIARIIIITGISEEKS